MGTQTLNIPGKAISKTTTATMPDDETSLWAPQRSNIMRFERGIGTRVVYEVLKLDNEAGSG